MGFITALIKLTGKLAGEGAEMYVRHSLGGFKEIKIPFTKKIADLKTDHGVDAEYVQGLIKRAQSTDSLKAIRDYLKSNRNDIPANMTNRMIKQVTDKAKHLEHMKEVKKVIDSRPDPFAFVDHHTIHEMIHHIAEWWC